MRLYHTLYVCVCGVISLFICFCVWKLSLPVCLLLEIAVPHHQTLLGENGANVRRIMLQSGTTICLPNPLAIASHHQNTIQVTGLMSNVLRARQLLLVSSAYGDSPLHRFPFPIT